MNSNHHRYALLLLATSLGGCFVVDKSAVNSLVPVEPTDAGMYPTAETCEGMSYTITQPGMYVVSTAGATSDLDNSLCGASKASPGPDVFLGVDAQQGQYWHFHVSGQTAGLDPVVGLFEDTNGVCNTASCTYVSNRCSDGNEHFGITFPGTPTNTTWRLAIDSANSTGGTYQIAAFRPTCGDGNHEHGEGCDDGNTADGDGCDSKCRDEITADGSNANNEPNDDDYWADHVMVTSGGPTITPSDFVLGICDPDVYVISVPAGKTFKVEAMQSNLTACAQFSTLTYNISAHTASGGSAGSLAADGSGCAVLTNTLSASGEVFVVIDGTPMPTALQHYYVRFSIQ